MTHPDSLRARREKIEAALSMGIDEAFISDLVETFYAAIRKDAVLGPIFSEHITDWPAHLGRMKAFWTAVLIEAGRYHGNPMAKHLAITGLDEQHFCQWLGLFKSVLTEMSPGDDATAFIFTKANMIGNSLLAGIQAAEIGSTEKPPITGRT